MPRPDPLDPSDLTGGTHHNPKSQRPSTLRPKGGPRTTLDKGASATEHLIVMPKAKRKHDPYGPSDVVGYMPALRGAILSIANLGLAGKKKGKG